ncbi:MAG: DUF5777 family beta-barrel protein [Bacteroidota bacterium]
MKTQKIFSILLMVCFFYSTAQTQDFIFQTFKDRRVINVHSVETLPKRKLDVRITHRFGDLAGDNGGFTTFFGLENATDVMIGAEYGISDNLTIGGFRTKGAGITPEGVAGLRQLLNGLVKLRLVRQTQSGTPVSVTALALASYSTADRLENTDQALQSFPKGAHRLAYHYQLMFGRKFSDGFSLQLNTGYTFRNLVPTDDENGIFSIGGATRLQINKVFGIIADATFPLSESRSGNGYHPALGIGLEIETGGHVFQVNFTNATAIMETDFIPYTTSDWSEGQFRLGFTVSRMFNL